MAPKVVTGADTAPLETAEGVLQSRIWQVAAVPDHVPLVWQVRVAEPTTSYPALQLYVAVVGVLVYVVTGADTVPLVGLVSAPQSRGAHVGAVPDHVPAAWQVRVALPPLPVSR